MSFNSGGFAGLPLSPPSFSLLFCLDSAMAQDKSKMGSSNGQSLHSSGSIHGYGQSIAPGGTTASLGLTSSQVLPDTITSQSRSSYRSGYLLVRIFNCLIYPPPVLIWQSYSHSLRMKSVLMNYKLHPLANWPKDQYFSGGRTTSRRCFHYTNQD